MRRLTVVLLFVVLLLQSAAADGTLAVWPTSFSLIVPTGRTLIHQTLDVRNASSGTLSYTIAVSSPSLLSVFPASGQSSGARAPHLVTINLPGPGLRSYAGEIVVSSDAGSSIVIPVTVTTIPTPRPAPPGIEWSTYLGGSNDDQVSGLVVDGNGNVFATGRTKSSDFPPSGTAPVSAPSGDVFVSKFNAAGELQWTTYLGGAGADVAYGLALDPRGDLLVAGGTLSSDFPTSGAFDPAYNGGTYSAGDAFVAKLRPDGGIRWSTYLGGSGGDWAGGVATDDEGNVYLAGLTYSSDFPTSGPYSSALNGTGDAFVAKLSSEGSLRWSRYVGGSGSETGYAVAVDGAANVYVAGTTSSADFSTGGPFARPHAAGDDGFAAAFDSNGAPIWATCLGGSQTDNARSIAADRAGHVYVTGDTASRDFPTSGSWPAPSSYISAMFLTKLSAGGALELSRTIGPTTTPAPPTYFLSNSLALDGAGNVYVTGGIRGGDFPSSLTWGTRYFGGMYDAFLARLDGNLALLTFFYLSGSSDDTGLCVRTDAASNLYVAGWTRSSSFPLKRPADPLFQPYYPEGFVTKFMAMTGAPVFTVAPSGYEYLIRAGDQPPTRTLEVRNYGGGTLTYDVLTSPPGLIAVTPPDGQGANSQTIRHSVTLNTAPLPPGRYAGEIGLVGNAFNSPVSLPVSVIVLGPPQTFTVGKGGGYDFDTIQAAIDAATTGDIVLVHPATYVEHINFKTKSLIVRGTALSDPAVVAATVIDGESSYTVVTFAGGETSSSLLSGFTIRNGHGTYGGGIRGNGAYARIESNVITGNKSSNYGGGVFRCNGLIAHNTIADNEALNGPGGGLYYCGGTIRDNLITRNHSLGGYGPGGGGLASCNGLIEHNTITGNSVSGPAGYGDGGALSRCGGTIRNNVIARNAASGDAGGLAGCDGLIANCTIAGNTAARSYGGVGGAQQLINCILWGNSATSSSQIGNSAPPTFSCIEGWTSGGIGNLSADPLFVRGRLGDYYLSQTAAGQPAQSPCVDAGSGTALELGLGNLTTRTDGTSDTGMVDLGYHYPPAPPLPPEIATSPTAFSLTWVHGTVTTNPVTRSLEVWNNGNGMLTYSLETSPTLPVEVQPASGQSDGTHITHTVTFFVEDLMVRNYRGQITITGNGVNSPVYIPLTVTVTPPPPPNISVVPDRIDTTIAAGWERAGRMLEVRNDSATTFSYIMDRLWLVRGMYVEPDNGTIAPGESIRHTIFFNTTLFSGTLRTYFEIEGISAAFSHWVQVNVTVVPRPYTILFPNGFETLPIGSTQQIRWAINNLNGSPLKIQIMRGKPNDWMGSMEVRTYSNIPATTTSFDWFIDPTTFWPGTNYWINLGAMSGEPTVWADWSDENFSLLAFNPPNLVLGNCDFAPAAPMIIQPGGPLTVSAFIENNGVGAAGRFWTEIWGSRTGGLTLDRFLADSLVLPNGLPAGGSYDWMTTRPLYSIPDGAYTVVYAADRPNQVRESNERDNRAVVRGKRLLVLRPQTQVDLVVENFELAPDPIYSGQALQFSGRVANRGTQPSGPFWIEFWGSWETPFPAPNFFLCDSIAVAGLAPGATINLADYPRRLYNVRPGVFWAGCVADREDAVNELDETNNYQFLAGRRMNTTAFTAFDARTDAIGPPDIDLIFASVAPLAPVQVAPGSTVTLTVSIYNPSFFALKPFWLEYYVSRDGGLTVCDFLTDSDRVPAIPGGGNWGGVFTKTLYGLPDGPYTVVVWADRLRENQPDAYRRRAIAGQRVLVMRPPSRINLTLADFAFQPGAAGAVQLGGRVANTGSADSGPFWIEFWAAAGDPDYPGLERFACDSIHVANLAPGATLQLSDYPRTLYNLRPGRWAIIGFVDRTDQVTETDETDNYQVLRDIPVPGM